MQAPQSDSITIRITGKEINNRLAFLEKSVGRLTYAAYIELTLIMLLLGKTFLL